MLSWILGLLLFLGALLGSLRCNGAQASFVPTAISPHTTFSGTTNHHHHRQQRRQGRVVQQFINKASSRSASAETTCTDDDVVAGASDHLAKLRSWSVADLKKELTLLNVAFDDVFEKEGLVRRLYEATMRQQSTTPTASPASFVDPPPPTTTKPAAPSTVADTNGGGVNNDNYNIIRTPLYFASSSDIQLAASKDGEGFMFSPTDQPFATIRIHVHHRDSNVKNNSKQDCAGAGVGGSTSAAGSFTLSLLLDTACSGIVLRPQVVEKHGLPQLQTPVTMTGAGGMAQKTGLTQLFSFSLDGGSGCNGDKNEKNHRFGPLPAAVQDIDVLPRQLDGIIGLSFLSQFAGIELDFKRGQVSFFRQHMPTTTDSDVVAQGDLTLVGSMGIYTVATTLGGRGPVSLLLDSGAAHTLLSWKGVNDLGLSRQSPAVVPLDPRMMMGAMGSDNAVMQFTHRLHVSSQINFENGRSNNSNSQLLPGLSLQGDDRRRLPIDIGNIPILDALQSQGVGGILGVDVMMRCAVVQMTFRGPKQCITLLN
jgi:Aspartyl protease